MSEKSSEVKECGPHMPCFKNGEGQWGHLGGKLCAHLGERDEAERGKSCVSFCLLTGELVNIVDLKAVQTVADIEI